VRRARKSKAAGAAAPQNCTPGSSPLEALGQY
jgi:hypothetical protein